MKKPQFFDIHSHVSFPEFAHDRGGVMDRMRYGDVHSITVGVDYESSREAVAVAQEHNEVYATVGLHPADNTEERFDEKKYQQLISYDKVVAVGECGLDYLRITGDVEAEKKRQHEEFEKQIAFAVGTNKPLMIHCREAHSDMIDILNTKKKEYGEKLRGNIHFFSEGIDIAQKYFDLNFTISFTGVITFTNDYDEAVRGAPLEMILSETDCPFVAPVPHRGKRNEPLFVKEVVKRIAEIRNEDFEKVRGALVDNALRVFTI